MPLHEYECDVCGRRFEKIQKFSDPPIDECPTCGGHVHKLISSPAFQFKGSGWYVTDYAKKESPAGGKTSDESKETKAAAKDTTGSDKDTSGKKDGASSAPSTPSGPSAPSSDAATKASSKAKSD